MPGFVLRLFVTVLFKLTATDFELHTIDMAEVKYIPHYSSLLIERPLGFQKLNEKKKDF